MRRATRRGSARFACPAAASDEKSLECPADSLNLKLEVAAAFRLAGFSDDSRRQKGGRCTTKRYLDFSYSQSQLQVKSSNQERGHLSSRHRIVWTVHQMIRSTSERNLQHRKPVDKVVKDV